MAIGIPHSRMNDKSTARNAKVVPSSNIQSPIRETVRNTFDHRKPLYTAEEAWRMLSLGKTKFYEVVGEGRIRVLKEGRKTLVAAGEIDRYVASLQTSA